MLLPDIYIDTQHYKNELVLSNRLLRQRQHAANAPQLYFQVYCSDEVMF